MRGKTKAAPVRRITPAIMLDSCPFSATAAGGCVPIGVLGVLGVVGVVGVDGGSDASIGVPSKITV